MSNHLYDALSAGTDDPDAACLILTDGGTVTHGDLHRRAARIAALLADAGLQPGDRVAAQLDKSVAMLALYLGTVRAGGAFLPLNPAYTPDEVAYFLHDAEPAVIVCDPAREGDMRRASATAAIFTLDGAGAGSLIDAAGAMPADRPPAARGPDDLAAILYTSGTTGRSKGAMLSHDNLLSNARTLCAAWQVTARDRLLHALPVFHTHGLFVACNTLLLAGGAMIWLPRFDPAEVIALLPRATMMMGVPTFYTRLLDRPDFTREVAAGARVFISGSAPLLPETHRRFEERTGQRILERYGMTETNMTTSNPLAGERRPGSVGPALPGVEVRITSVEAGADADVDGDPATAPAGRPDGEIGMIEVRGPNVFQGYWRMPDKTAAELRPDGWFITGDLGTRDADGYVTIVGRGKDLVITGGLNVYPREVEMLIDDLPGVLESAVIGVPHPDFGEAVVAVVAPRPGAALEPDALMNALTDRIARFKQPKRVIVVPELPRNAMGKVQKAALRARHAGLFGGAG